MNVQSKTVTGKALWVTEKSPDLDNLLIDVIEPAIPQHGPGQVLVEIRAAGVNPSDVKASLGHMPHAVWPRVPGRDFAGVVVDGPAHLIGKEIWGGGGELGITQNGSHAKYMALPQAAVREKPVNFSMEEAGSIGVPFITAFEGLREAGGVQPWDNVLVCGANGKVGQAAIQLATMAGATVFGVEYKPMEFLGHSAQPIEMFDSSSQDVAELVREKTGGRGADIVFNTVGSPYFEMANKALAKQGRQVFISTFDRAVDFDIFTFFRGRHKFIGIDTLALDSVYGAKIFDVLKPKFEAGVLKPFPINPETVYGFDDAAKAYASVLRATPERVILKP
ncbi:zinc-binding dehydrogenase [Roseibium aggregatum]|uniref:quinone oxidoreductase family protein n=1 Tax=Stappiaceae TaxID=2821832 RepID=UPI001268DF66|nr:MULTISPECIES: zinc-binding alcohol dehydrogenase family protein [Stappiaceae]QFS97768.1 Phthioceranic/hydroxyphthioceranic acid synthase [Labrenzia sp. THAF191b]QFT04083.1 Phthioceranic/hydroxyphthioceranic acid synthase [Labrenzia sp. THAF191a]QFT15625.1 Phthioceranic/hydroxyphthioceranic acid synthase [Labrenzia sp. THAF187b]UES54962.1 zinc-binding dehydrogenase [Roseibium aggregatum]